MSTPPPRFKAGIHHLTVDRSSTKPTTLIRVSYRACLWVAWSDELASWRSTSQVPAKVWSGAGEGFSLAFAPAPGQIVGVAPGVVFGQPSDAASVDHRAVLVGPVAEDEMHEDSLVLGEIDIGDPLSDIGAVALDEDGILLVVGGGVVGIVG